MTLNEWLNSGDPDFLLAFLQRRLPERQLRLFSCACCRAIRHLIAESSYRDIVEEAERFADGKSNVLRLNSVEQRAYTKCGTPGQNHALWAAVHTASQQYVYSADGHDKSWTQAAWAVVKSQGTDSAFQDASRAQANLLRDIFLNPFYPATLDPAWQTTNVLALAEAVYNDRAFDRMPILGDALEEAGCTSAEILDHCRSGSEHVRGCWVVDLILGKA
jgi:hypothetical protein